MKKYSKLRSFLCVLFGILIVIAVSIVVISLYNLVHSKDVPKQERSTIQASAEPLEERIFVSKDGTMGIKSQYNLDNKLVACTTFKPHILDTFVADSIEKRDVEESEENIVEESVPTPTPAPTTDPVAVEEKSGRVLGSKFTLSHFCLCAKCCGTVGQATASGRMPEQNVTVAVDPRVIKLGTRLKIEIPDGNGGYVVYRANARADDTGGAVKGNKIDVLVNEHQEALNLGLIHNARVTILED